MAILLALAIIALLPAARAMAIPFEGLPSGSATIATVPVTTYDGSVKHTRVTFAGAPQVDASVGYDLRESGSYSGLTTNFVAAETGAADAMNGVRLGQQLARESGNSAFTASGELQPSVIAGSRPIISGSELGNPQVISTLTSDGSKISDWAKYSTDTIRGPSGNFQVHYYMNQTTGAVNYGYDYKIVFTGGG